MTDEQHATMAGAVASVGKAIVIGLPAQFLALVAMNTIFILGLLYFLNNQNSSRERMMGKFIDACDDMQQQILHK